MENEIDIPRGIIKQDSLKPYRVKMYHAKPFHIAEEDKVPGMEYRWVAAAIWSNGDEKLTENLEDAVKDGWLPLSRAANPQLMNDRRNHYSFGDYIMEGSSILCGRFVQSRIDMTDVTPLSLPDNCGFEKLILPLDDDK